MSRHELTDQQGIVSAPLIPKPKPGPGRKRHDARQSLNGILCVLQTGCPGADGPRAYGSPATCWRRFRAWSAESTWERMGRMRFSPLDAQGKLEWAPAVLAGSCVPANKGALGAATPRSAQAAK